MVFPLQIDRPQNSLLSERELLQSFAPTAEYSLEARLDPCEPQQPTDAPLLPVESRCREPGHDMSPAIAEYHPRISVLGVGGPGIAARTGWPAGLGKADPACVDQRSHCLIGGRRPWGPLPPMRASPEHIENVGAVPRAPP